MTRTPPVDLVVIGPPKSGSSSLFEALANHHGVDAAHAKEPVFFSEDRGLDLGQADGPNRSGGHTRGLTWFDALFRGPGDAVRLEGTTDYFASPSAPGLLVHHAPNVHLVASLREPAARIVSQYWHERRFTELAELGELVASGHPRLDYWIRCSSYGAALTRWLASFPVQQLHVIGFNQIRVDVEAAAGAIHAAVGLAPVEADLPSGADARRANAAGTSKSTALHRLLTVSKARRFAEDLPSWVQRPLRSLARRAMQANLDRGPYPDTDPAVLHALRARLAADRAILLPLLDEHWPAVAAEARAWPTTGP
ncbi:MAG: hypothetical protein ACI867_002520 [Glaciecola sp.]|jgi:hypothetical protein